MTGASGQAIPRRGIVAALAAMLILVYLPTLAWLGGQWFRFGLFSWQARDWSHGPLVVLLAAYLVWRNRRNLSSSKGSPWGMAFVGGGLAVHVVGAATNAPYLSAYSLIPVSLGIVCLLAGHRATQRLLAPFLLLSLAVPFPATEWGITGLLARVVASASVPLARLAGAPVVRSGQLITVGQDEYMVEPLCSGFNLIMALLALGVPLLYLRGVSWRGLGAALLWLPALGLATKVLLVSLILVLTPNLGQERALFLYHGWLGVLFYLVGLAAVLVVAHRTFASRDKGQLMVSQ